MQNGEILSDEILRARRYPHRVQTRKDWICNRCGKRVKKGNYIEHSHSADMKLTIELCVPCVNVLNKANQ